MVYPCGVYRGFVEFMGHPVYNPISRLFWVMEIMKLGNHFVRDVCTTICLNIQQRFNDIIDFVFVFFFAFLEENSEKTRRLQ